MQLSIPSMKSSINDVEAPDARLIIISIRYSTTETAPVMIPAIAIPLPGACFLMLIIPVIIAAIPAAGPRQQQQLTTIPTIPHIKDTIARVELP